MIKINYMGMITVVLVWCLFCFPVTTGMAEELELNLPPMPPSIEELTGGKVKIGDLITKDNVELVKDYLTAGLYQNVKGGMVLRMAEGLPPEKLNPRTYLEATERNKGRAVVDDRLIVRLKDGSPWPGGMPFTEPKNAQEVMGYVRFGHAYDDGHNTSEMFYVNKHGKCYKNATFTIEEAQLEGRLKVPPLGKVPGMEDCHETALLAFTSPLELKGLGQLTMNFVDDTENYDQGFAYLPAFKRTMRISATTYQDNMGGSDLTYGDAQGLREPFGSWNFKLIEKKYALVTEWLRERSAILKADGMGVDPQLEFDVGRKYPRLGWVINPVYVIEATPRDTRHIYGKKIIYVSAPYFALSVIEEMGLVDIYDRTGELWKFYQDVQGCYLIHPDGENYTACFGLLMYDLQTGNSTHAFQYYFGIDTGIRPKSLTVKKLLQMGR